MKRLKIALALVLLSFLTIYLSLFAATTTIYTAPTGSVSPSLQTTMYLTGGGIVILNPVVGPNCYYGMTCGFPSGYVGTYMSYVLPNGSNAKLTNFSGVFAPFGTNYEIKGQASGVDSEGRYVKVNSVQATMHISCRSGRGGGCSKIYSGGTLSLTVGAVPTPTPKPTAKPTAKPTPKSTPTPQDDIGS